MHESLIPIDDLIEIWVRVHKEALAKAEAPLSKDELSWWREAFAYLRPTAEDDAILDDDEEKR